MRGEITGDEAEQLIRKAMTPQHAEIAESGAYLQSKLHGQALSTILMCCFCLESYINSFAWFFVHESDLLGLMRIGRKTSADVLLDAIDRLSVKEKWQKVAQLGDGSGFDHSQRPYQDFKYLFNFRDDHVHDKAVPYSEDRAVRRYNKKFPDPVSGLLDLNHSLYAAVVYLDMVQELHRLTGVSASDFQHHYNLAPWFDEQQLKDLQDTALCYRAVFPQDSF